MRIISGKYRGKRIQPPKKFPSRPTTDMAKESLFNILNNQVDWEDMEILDLFAGTGNISLEFISRGAKSVLSIDKHPLTVRHLNHLQKEWDVANWSILKKDVFKFFKEYDQQYDLIFADPPFGMKETDQLPSLIFERNLLKENGILILEHGKENTFETHEHIYDQRRYGGVYFSFFR